MKKIFYVLMMAAVAMGVSSCKKEGDDEYTGKNKIYLTTEGGSIMKEMGDGEVTVKVQLSSSLKKDAEFTFVAVDDADGVIKFNENPLTIAAGVNTASFTVSSNKLGVLTEDKVFEITMTEFPAEKMEIAESAKVTVEAYEPIDDLSAEKQALVAGYKSAYGIDLGEWIGELEYELEIVSPADGYYDFEMGYTRNYTGTTIITISDNATAEKPVLSMTKNPLGMNEYLYEVYRKETVENDDLSSYSNFIALTSVVKFTKDSEETFATSLDNLVLDPKADDNNISFLGQVQDYYGDIISIIPFEYSFSAYDREKATPGDTIIQYDTDYDGIPEEQPFSILAEEGYMGGTLNPASYLCLSDSSYDYWENEPSDFIEPKATLDVEAGTLSFEFAFDHSLAGGYTQVRVTYKK